MTHLKTFFSPVLIPITFFLLFFSGCQNSEPIKIGYAGGLTGRLADLGLYGRNGVTLAVEEVNSQGGVNGRTIELIVKDDKQKPDVAVQVDKELIAEGVVAIIGHMTSAMSVAAVPLINKEKILLFSPTTATNQLNGIDDFFLRIMLSNTATITTLARHVIDERNIKKIVVVYDDNNRAFSAEWAELFSKYAAMRQGESIGVPFSSTTEQSFSSLAENILEYNPEGILIVAAALDAALICQQIRKKGSDLPLFTTMWSMTEDFIQHGGSAAENVTFVNWFDPEHPSESSQKFRQKYTKRFSRDPNFVSHFSYEAATILLDALKKDTAPLSLKNTIISTGEFQGTQGTITIDEYGDVQRPLFLMEVKNGKHHLVE